MRSVFLNVKYQRRLYSTELFVTFFMYSSDPSNQTPRATQQTDQLLKINIVEVDGVHR